MPKTGFAQSNCFFREGLLTAEGASSIGNMVMSSASDEEGWQKYLHFSSSTEGKAASEPSTARAPVREEAPEVSSSTPQPQQGAPEASTGTSSQPAGPSQSEAGGPTSSPSPSWFEGAVHYYQNRLGDQGEGSSSAPNEGEAINLPTGTGVMGQEQAGPSNAGPSAQDPGEDAGPSSKRRRVDSGPDSGSGPQYLNVPSDTERRAAPEQRPPEQPQAQPLELEQPQVQPLELEQLQLENFRHLLETHKKIADTIQNIFQDLHTRVPAGFQSERLTEMLEERHGGRSLGGILQSLQEEGRNSPFFREVQTDFQALRDSGGTEATLRKEWQGARQ